MEILRSRVQEALSKITATTTAASSPKVLESCCASVFSFEVFAAAAKELSEAACSNNNAGRDSSSTASQRYHLEADLRFMLNLHALFEEAVVKQMRNETIFNEGEKETDDDDPNGDLVLSPSSTPATFLRQQWISLVDSAVSLLWRALLPSNSSTARTFESFVVLLILSVRSASFASDVHRSAVLSVALRRGLAAHVSEAIAQSVLSRRFDDAEIHLRALLQLDAAESDATLRKKVVDSFSGAVTLIACRSDSADRGYDLAVSLSILRGFSDVMRRIMFEQNDDGEGCDGDDEEEDEKADSGGGVVVVDRVILPMFRRCCLVNRYALEFFIVALHLAASEKRDIQRRIWHTICQEVWAHNDEAEDDEQQQRKQADSSLSSDGRKKKKTLLFGGSSSAFLHSSRVETADSAADAVMVLLTFAQWRKESCDALFVSEFTGPILRGISFRLSMHSRDMQRRGALVATIYFDLTASSSSSEDQQPPAPTPKFAQFPDLLPQYNRDSSLWLRFGLHLPGEDKVVIDSVSADLSRDRGVDSHSAAASSTASHHRAASASSSRSSKYWIFQQQQDNNGGSEEGESLLVVHPAFIQQQQQQQQQQPSDKWKRNLVRQYPEWMAGTKKIEDRVAAIDRFIQRQQELENACAAAASSPSPSSSSFLSKEQSIQQRQERDRWLLSRVSTLRELETKISHGETSASGGGDSADMIAAAEAAMSALPDVLDSAFRAVNHENSAQTQTDRGSVGDNTVVSRLFIYCIGSSHATSSTCAAAAQRAAGLCVALAPGAILPECRRVLAGGDFAVTHKLRVFAAMQDGMERLGRVVSGSSNQARRRFAPVSSSRALSLPLVYPPLHARPSTADEPKPQRSGEGTVRWRSKKLSAEYQARQQEQAATATINLAVKWAVTCVDAALLLPSETWLLQDGDGFLAIQAARTVTLVADLVSVSARSTVLTQIAFMSLDSLAALATQHFLPAVRINALVTLGGLLQFRSVRAEVLFASSSTNGTLFLAKLAKLQNDPDAGVRLVVSDLLQVCLS